MTAYMLPASAAMASAISAFNAAMSMVGFYGPLVQSPTCAIEVNPKSHIIWCRI